VETIESDADFRGLSVASDKGVWVSGTRGTVPDCEKLDFRDVESEFGRRLGHRHEGPHREVRDGREMRREASRPRERRSEFHSDFSDRSRVRLAVMFTKRTRRMAG